MHRRGFPFTSRDWAGLKAFPVTSATDFCILLHSSARGPTASAEAAGDVSAIETQPIRNPIRGFMATSLLVGGPTHFIPERSHDMNSQFVRPGRVVLTPFDSRSGHRVSSTVSRLIRP